tara:strand:+ start:2784 stop:5252 length:2469 start_codon:yes stop_codon:yes gene_type:complete
MVFICDQPYNSNKLDEYLSNYPFELSDFQKYALDAIIENNHILITAHTGSGKTLPAEFAIEYFHKLNKKVIYTSPIKALSNQKFHEFTKKFPHISFGILTGDIKFNPSADVLIMTTEILRNTLLHKKINASKEILQFDMDFDTELAAVVFDEIHYINDADRGKIWEESIMLMPEHVQLIMLSATIDQPEKFASWIETTKNLQQNLNKQVYLANTNHRVVPLKHFCFNSLPQGPLKLIKDKEFKQFLEKFLDKPIPIKDDKNCFYDTNYVRIKKMKEHCKKANIYVKPPFVFNNLVSYLHKNNMLPAIFFVFSRKLVEKYARMININIIDYDDDYPATIRHKCNKIIRKLPNHEEYLNLPEYEDIVRLVEKGIAIHHSGILPIFREMIEILFGEGHIKLLFATETFAVGINMPTKTVVFNNFEKFNGNHMRLILPHEYTQMAGRAGRRGLDTIGYVIHCTNLFALPSMEEYKNLLNGPPQKLTSKFKTTFNLILQLCNTNNESNFTSNSMIKNDIEKEINNLTISIQEMKEKIELKEQSPNFNDYIKNKDNVFEFLSLQDGIKSAKNKKRKEFERAIKNFEQDRNFIKYLNFHKDYTSIHENMVKSQDYLDYLKKYFNIQANNIKTFLQNENFIEDNKLSEKGIIATHIQEAHCLVLAELIINTNYFEDISESEIVAILSCFTNVRVHDDYKTTNINTLDTTYNLKQQISFIEKRYNYYLDKENEKNIDSGETYDLHFDLVNETLKWCDCEDERTCKQLLTEIQNNKEVFIGEFTKAILKINNMINEFVIIGNAVNRIDFLNKIQNIPKLLLKFVATTQSLYV